MALKLLLHATWIAQVRAASQRIVRCRETLISRESRESRLPRRSSDSQTTVSSLLEHKEVLMYVITGASGNTGSVVAETLLARGEKVRVVGRNPGHLEKFTRRGAEAAIADLADPDAHHLTNAFSGATAVYAMIPPDLTSADGLAYYGVV